MSPDLARLASAPFVRRWYADVQTLSGVWETWPVFAQTRAAAIERVRDDMADGERLGKLTDWDLLVWPDGTARLRWQMEREAEERIARRSMREVA